MFTFEVEPSGIVSVEIVGTLDVADAREYLAGLRKHLNEMRRTRGNALALVDGRKGEIQSEAVMGEMRDIQSILIAGERDRAAYIVENSLAKMQARQLASTDQLQVFLSPTAARTWLLAYEAN